MAALTACQATTDPSQGGFFSGVAAINSGAYEDRVSAAERDLDADRARNAQLETEIVRLETALAGLKGQIRLQASQTRSIDSLTRQRIDRVLATTPNVADTTQRLDALAKAIEDARALSADLARLAG